MRIPDEVAQFITQRNSRCTEGDTAWSGTLIGWGHCFKAVSPY